MYLISKLCHIDLTRIMVQKKKISTIDALGCTRHLKDVIVLSYPKREEPLNVNNVILKTFVLPFSLIAPRLILEAMTRRVDVDAQTKSCCFEGRPPLLWGKPQLMCCMLILMGNKHRSSL